MGRRQDVHYTINPGRRRPVLTFDGVEAHHALRSLLLTDETDGKVALKRLNPMECWGDSGQLTEVFYAEPFGGEQAYRAARLFVSEAAYCGEQACSIETFINELGPADRQFGLVNEVRSVRSIPVTFVNRYMEIDTDYIERATAPLRRLLGTQRSPTFSCWHRGAPGGVMPQPAHATLLFTLREPRNVKGDERAAEVILATQRALKALLNADTPDTLHGTIPLPGTGFVGADGLARPYAGLNALECGGRLRLHDGSDAGLAALVRAVAKIVRSPPSERPSERSLRLYGAD